MNPDWLILAVLVAMLAQYERDSRYLRKIARCVCEIAGQKFPVSVSIGQVSQTPPKGAAAGLVSSIRRGDRKWRNTIMAFPSVPAGGSGNFVETPSPAGSAFPAGSALAWATTDTLVTLTPTPDGTGVQAAVALTDTAASFTLNFTGTSPDGTQTATGSLVVPIVQPVAPFPSSVTISQVS
jgi:hypothetical protein